MKTHIIHLQPEDDMASVQDQMRRAGGGRILLVWPGNKPMFSRKLDVLILKRHSQSQGAELFLVTRDPEVRYFASKIGIPVFRSLRRAQQAPWQGISAPTADEPPPPDLKRIRQLQRAIRASSPLSKATKPWQRYIAFGTGILAFIVILGFLLPSAEIRLQPISEIQSITLEVQANPQITSFNLSGALPVQEISVVVEDDLTRPSSGEIGIPQGRANGEVRFTNITDQAVNIPIGTIVRTLGNEPIRFLVTDAGELNAQAGDTVSLPVEAVNPGEIGNLPANALVSIDGPLGLNLSITNPEATDGGNDQSSPAPSTQDYTSLRSDLTDDLIDRAIQQIQIELNDQDLILPVKQENIEILEESFEPAEVQPATQLHLNIRAAINLQIVRWADLTRLAEAVLDGNLAGGFESQANSLGIDQVGDPELNDAGLFEWQLEVQNTIQTILDPNTVIELVRGKNPQQASQALDSNFSLDNPPEINMQPAWWPWIPLVPFRISVISN